MFDDILPADDSFIPNEKVIEDLKFLRHEIIGILVKWDDDNKPTLEYRGLLISNVLSNMVADYLLYSNDTLERLVKEIERAGQLKRTRGK